MLKTFRYLIAFGCFLVSAFFVPEPVYGQGEDDHEKVNLIVDAEIENALRTFLDPMLSIAGIPPERIQLVIVNTPVVNASAISGGVMAVNTGLLLKIIGLTQPGAEPNVLASELNQLLGVFAHEVGHFLGGHHARIAKAADKSKTTMLMGFLLGGLAAGLKQPDIAMAALLGSQDTAIKTYLAHRRGEESAADQAATEILDKLQLSSTGFASFMQALGGDNLRMVQKNEGYFMTHPPSQERTRFILNHVVHSPFSGNAPAQEWLDQWARVRAKIKGFFEEPDKLIRTIGFPKNLMENYTLAIAHYRKFELPKTLAILEILLAAEPKNPYFNEFYGQVLFESGRIKEAIPFYQKALQLLPHSPQLMVQVSHALIEEGSPPSLTEAEQILTRLISRDRTQAMAWHFLAVAYGKNNNIGAAAEALAQKASLMGDTQTARQQAATAVKHLKKGTPQWQRAQDILDTSEKPKH